MGGIESEIEQAQADLAFALAQGDAAAEDEAADRIERLEAQRDEQDAAEAGEL